MASTSSTDSFADYMRETKAKMATHTLNRLDGYLTLGWVSVDIITDYILAINRMIREDHPIDRLRCVELMRRCKEVIPAVSPLSETIDLSITVIYQGHHEEIMKQMLNKINQALEDVEINGTWATGKVIYDIFAQVIATYSARPDFWKLSLWRTHNFEVEIGKLKEAITESETKCQDDNLEDKSTPSREEMVTMLSQLESWHAKTKEHNN